MELIVHPMCPFAQRSILTKAFKGIDCPILHVDLVQKPAELLNVNPKGTVPALKINQNNKQYHLFESLQVCEYLQSLPGPYLYPRLPSGQINPLEKTIIDMHIKVYVQPIIFPVFKTFASENFPLEACEDLIKVLTPVNDQFLNHGFFMAGVLGRDQLTMADLVLLPFIQRVLIAPGLAEAVEGHDRSIQNIRNWYARMNELEWVRAANPGENRLTNQFMKIKAGGFKGLELPLTNYDQ